MYTIEWEMPYFNMGSTFDYAEMAYLMVPRPFMVERGHNDRVGRDRWVALRVRQGALAVRATRHSPTARDRVLQRRPRHQRRRHVPLPAPSPQLAAELTALKQPAALPISTASVDGPPPGETLGIAA